MPPGLLRPPDFLSTLALNTLAASLYDRCMNFPLLSNNWWHNTDTWSVTQGREYHSGDYAEGTHRIQVAFQIHVVFQWHWPFECADHVYRALFRAPNPLRELHGVRSRRRQEDHGHMLCDDARTQQGHTAAPRAWEMAPQARTWKHDDDFFPNNATVSVVDVVHLSHSIQDHEVSGEWELLHTMPLTSSKITHSMSRMRSAPCASNQGMPYIVSGQWVVYSPRAPHRQRQQHVRCKALSAESRWS